MQTARILPGLAICLTILAACVSGGPVDLVSSANNAAEKDYQQAPQSVAEREIVSATPGDRAAQSNTGTVEAWQETASSWQTGTDAAATPVPPVALEPSSPGNFSEGNGLALAESPVAATVPDPTVTATGQIGEPINAPAATFASESTAFGPFLRPKNRKTYLINGLASNIEAIGYGFRNLSKKIPGSVLHNYAGPVESSTIILSRVTREIKAAYARDRDLEINLIGISFGANIVTVIAQELDRAGIPVNYLATLDGPAMVPIRDNVRAADNFTCTNLDCFKTSSRLAWGNRDTVFDSFRLKTSHIPLADHPQVHSRVISQINRSRTALLTAQ